MKKGNSKMLKIYIYKKGIEEKGRISGGGWGGSTLLYEQELPHFLQYLFILVCTGNRLSGKSTGFLRMDKPFFFLSKEFYY